MKLIIVLLFWTFFAFSECMRLGDVSYNSILEILKMHSDLIEPKGYLTSSYFLGASFKSLNQEGTTQLSRIIVQAYNNKELNDDDIKTIIYEAIYCRNVNAYDYISREIYQSSLYVLQKSAINGQEDILSREYAKISERNYFYVIELRKLLPAVIRAGHVNILRWFAENGILPAAEVYKTLKAALEVKNQEMIDILFNYKMYIEYSNGTRNLLTYKEITMRIDQSSLSRVIFMDAVTVGNLIVVRYYFYQKLPLKFHNWTLALSVAVKNGHAEIVKFLEQPILESLKLFRVEGSLSDYNAREAFNAVLAANFQNIIEFMLTEVIYEDPNDGSIRLNFEDRIRRGQTGNQKLIFIKAAEVGNMDVVEFFLGRDLLTEPENLKEVQKAAESNGHTEIANRIHILLMI